jgi:hypothetical protein
MMNFKGYTASHEKLYNYVNDGLLKALFLYLSNRIWKKATMKLYQETQLQNQDRNQGPPYKITFKN